MRLIPRATALAMGVLLAACGGGDDATSATPQGMALNALAAKADVNTATVRAAPERRAQAYSPDLAAQLFALAESAYAVYFPSKQATRSFNGWAYRYYPETQTYLAVIDSGVYVMGGAFGPEAVYLNEITAFVKSPASGKDRPLTASILAQCPEANTSTSTGFYKCMVGHLNGAQTFDSSKSCRLDISDDGIFTLVSDNKSITVGPEFGLSIYSKIAAADFLFATVEAPGVGYTNTIKFQFSSGFSFARGGIFDAEATPAGSSNASISCKLTVPK